MFSKAGSNYLAGLWRAMTASVDSSGANNERITISFKFPFKLFRRSFFSGSPKLCSFHLLSTDFDVSSAFRSWCWARDNWRTNEYTLSCTNSSRSQLKNLRRSRKFSHHHTEFSPQNFGTPKREAQKKVNKTRLPNFIFNSFKLKQWAEKVQNVESRDTCWRRPQR